MTALIMAANYQHAAEVARWLGLQPSEWRLGTWHAMMGRNSGKIYVYVTAPQHPDYNEIVRRLDLPGMSFEVIPIDEGFAFGEVWER